MGVLVNAAGDVASSGGMGHGPPFRIGIADPFRPRRLAEIVELTGAIATSGSYERGNHLIDPHSGRRAARAASASVTGPDLGLADALATALAVAGRPAWPSSSRSTVTKDSSSASMAAGNGPGAFRSPRIWPLPTIRPRRPDRRRSLTCPAGARPEAP